MIGWTTIRDSALWIADMGRAVNPFRRHAARLETFDVAMKRLNVDDASLARNRRNFTVMSTIHGVATVIGCLGVGHALLQGTAGGFAWFGFTAVNAALAFTFAFRAWQIAARRLGSIGDFMRGKR